MSQAGPLNEPTTIPPEVATEYVTNSGTAVPAFNVLEVLGSGSITTTGSGNVITISISATGFTWNTITSASNPTQIVAENAYITAGVSQCTLLLPASATIGDAFIVTGLTSLFKIMQNANQFIIAGAFTTTVGNTGYLSSNSVGDDVEIVYIATNTFKVRSPYGNLTVV